MSLLAPIAIAAALGWIVLMLLLPSNPDDWLTRAMWVSLALGLGLGISSVTYAFWLIMPVNSRFALVAIEMGALAIGVLIVRFRKRNTRPAPVFDQHRQPKLNDRGVWILAPALTALASASVYGFWLVQRVQPHGGWDAFAMYNARARFLFRGSETWIDAFRVSGMLHPDYPVLVPGTIARFWTYVGSETTLAPSLVGFCFVASTVVLLFTVLGTRRGVAAASLATMLLCGLRTVQYGNDSFVLVGALQITDVPFAFYLLAALVLALPNLGTREQGGSLVAAGLFASLAAWSKNEGFLMVMVFMLSLAVVEVASHGWRSGARRVGFAMVGSFPILALVIAFKFWIAPPGDIFSSSNVGIAERILDSSRYSEVFVRLVESIGQHGGGAMIALAIAILALGWRSRQEMVDHALPALVVIGLSAGYFFVYIITPHDLSWHQVSSQLRLLTHLWPAILLAGFLLASDPGVAFSGRASRDESIDRRTSTF